MKKPMLNSKQAMPCYEKNILHWKQAMPCDEKTYYTENKPYAMWLKTTVCVLVGSSSIVVQSDGVLWRVCGGATRGNATGLSSCIHWSTTGNSTLSVA